MRGDAATITGPWVARNKKGENACPAQRIDWWSKLGKRSRRTKREDFFLCKECDDKTRQGMDSTDAGDFLTECQPIVTTAFLFADRLSGCRKNRGSSRFLDGSGRHLPFSLLGTTVTLKIGGYFQLYRLRPGGNVANKPFAEARRFLYYTRGATGTAMLASFGLSVAFVAFLAVIFLLVELLVYQGRLLDQPEGRKALASWCQKWFPEDEEARRDILHTADQGYGVGLVSLAVRNRDTWYGEMAATIAHNWAWTRRNPSYLAGLVGIFFTMGLIHIGLALLLHAAATRAVVEAAHRIRRSVYLHTLRLGRLSLAGSDRTPPVPTYSRELETMQEGLYVWLTTTFKEPAKILLVLTFALALDSSSGWPWLSALGLILALLLWLVGGYISQWGRRQDRQHSTAAAEQLALVQESLRIMRLVLGYGMETYNGNRVERQLADHANHTRHLLFDRVKLRQLLIFMALIAAAVVLYAVGWALLNSHLRLSQTVIVLVALASLYRPLRLLVERQRIVEAARRVSEPIFKFLESEEDVRQVVGAEFLPPMSRELVFQNVTLRDPVRRESLLQQISFTVSAGERIAIVGDNEREKLAIACLIPRFLDPSEGEIRIDGRKLPWVTLESVRNQVMLVLQDDLVFTDTVRNNISCGDPSASLPKVIEAAKMARAHQFIQKLPQGYDTVVGDLGHALSRSEKYRLALARAILRDPTLVVIEEPDDQFDEDVRALLEDAMTRFLPNRTVLFLARRMASIRTANRVMFLHKGKLEAVGSHEDLLQRNDRYRHEIYMAFNVFADES